MGWGKTLIAVTVSWQVGSTTNSVKCKRESCVNLTCSVTYLLFVQDVRALIARLRCLVSSYEIPNWQHLDFVWGLDAANVLYPKIVDILRHHAAL